MNKIEFFKEFKELCNYYNNKIYENQRLTALYYNKVKNKSLDQFKQQINKIIASSKFMPKVADFSEKAKVGIHQRNYTDEDFESCYDNLKDEGGTNE